MTLSQIRMELAGSGLVYAPHAEAVLGRGRPTVAEIDLGALSHNLAHIRRTIGTRRVFAVVKANAYGHGMTRVAQHLQSEGVDGLCVGLVEEGLELRAAGVRAPILVLNGAYGQSHAELLRAGLTPVIYDLEQAIAFVRARAGGRVDVHLKINTGMTRLGIQPAELDVLLSGLESTRAIRIEGVMTHLSSADSDSEFTAQQLRVFDRAVAMLRARGHRARVLHVANSAGTFATGTAHYDAVRTGLALYGVPPLPGREEGLKPVMRLRSQILAVQNVLEATPVGYDQAFVTRRPSRIACVPIGYGDGYLRAASNRGHMLVRGRRCPIVGRISMDLTTIDVTDIPEARVGDEVVVLGQQTAGRLTAADLAAAADTIPYEVLCNISARVPRWYFGS